MIDLLKPSMPNDDTLQNMIPKNKTINSRANINTTPQTTSAIDTNRGSLVNIHRPTMIIQRPKRGRRPKRPDLSEAERRQIRAMQSREATRRSRAKSRVEKETLKVQLKEITLERDHLLEIIRRNGDRITDETNKARYNHNKESPRTTSESTSLNRGFWNEKENALSFDVQSQQPRNAHQECSQGSQPFRRARSPHLDAVQPVEPPHYFTGFEPSSYRRRHLHPLAVNDSLLRFLPQKRSLGSKK